MKAEGSPRSHPSPPERRQHRCPTCRRLFTTAGADAGKPLKSFPFCCARCKLVDLGAWFDGDYRIPAREDDASDEPPTQEPPQ